MTGYFLSLEKLLYFDFVAIFVTLMLIGRWLHIRMIEHNRSQLQARERAVVALKRKNDNSAFESIVPGQVKRGDILEVGEGSLIPVTASLLSDTAELSLDWINGEPGAVAHQTGAAIPAGAKNNSNKSILIRADESFAGSVGRETLSLRTRDR